MSTNDLKELKISIVTYFHNKHDGNVMILIFRFSEGLRRHFDVKYDVRYHKMAKNHSNLRMPTNYPIS